MKSTHRGCSFHRYRHSTIAATSSDSSLVSTKAFMTLSWHAQALSTGNNDVFRRSSNDYMVWPPIYYECHPTQGFHLPTAPASTVVSITTSKFTFRCCTEPLPSVLLVAVNGPFL
ncbi:hypothetical protein AAHE18_18G048700 [Arachis hypogaea]